MAHGLDFDTLQIDEQLYLRRTAAADLPAHHFSLEANSEGLAWVVLEPSSRRVGLLRFTICRISPSVMVLVEDHDQRRQVCSTASVEDAMAFVRDTADQAILATMNAHPAHPVPQ